MAAVLSRLESLDATSGEGGPVIAISVDSYSVRAAARSAMTRSRQSPHRSRPRSLSAKPSALPHEEHTDDVTVISAYSVRVCPEPQHKGTPSGASAPTDIEAES